MDFLSIANLRRKILPGPETLHELIACKDVDHRTAIMFMTEDGSIQRMSYAALRTQSLRLADRICSAITGFGENIIPVMLPQSLELYIAWIAVLRAGAAFCPVSSDTPKERLRFILKDISANVIVTTSEHRTRHARGLLGLAVLEVDETHAVSDGSVLHCKLARTSHAVNVSPTATAYVMYTSGSTGVPKGVKISHQSITQSLLAHDVHIPPFKRFLQFASPTFDVSVFEVFFPLFRGATLASRHREEMLADLPGTINSLQTDAAELTPTVAGNLLKTRRAVPCLQLLLTIGEMLTQHIIEEFGQSDEQDGILYAMYGPTEASVHCTMAPKLISSSSTGNIGKPLQTVTAFIISTSDNLSCYQTKVLPRGQSGELAIAGQLASGYLNRQDQTQNSFIQLAEYGTVYRTGDKARLLDSGELEIHGRLSDEQFKIRGQRTERGEIESIACKTPGVSQAVAAMINDVLVLFCIRHQQDVSAQSIEANCKSWLPRFMWPGDIVLLDSDAPRLPSGKIDRKELEAQYLRRVTVSVNSDIDTAGTEMQRTIANCIARVLGCSIDLCTPLWSSGLDSLQAIKVASQLCKKHIFLSPKELLEYDTVTDLAKKWTQVSAGFQHDQDDHVHQTENWHWIKKRIRSSMVSDGYLAEVEDIVQCSTIQTVLLAETSGNRDLHFNWIKLHVGSTISPDQFREALRTLAQRNEILRSGFATTLYNEVPFVQIIWCELDLRQKLSLLHPLQLDITQENTGLSVTVRIHHALYDGWSWDLVMHDLQLILDGHLPNQRPQYRAVAKYRHLQNQTKPADSGQSWRSRLANISRSLFPNLRGCKVSKKSKGIAIHTLGCTVAKLNQASRCLHISRQTVISAALALLLSSYSNASDIVFGVVASGRTIRVTDIQDIIGPCITTLPLHISISGVQTSQDLLQQVASSLHDLLDFEGFSLRDIKASCGIQPDEVLFDTLFVWQEGPMHSQSVRSNLEIVDTVDCLDYACVIEAEPKHDSVVVKLTYEAMKMSPQHAALFLSQLDQLVNVFVDQENQSLSKIWAQSIPDVLSIANPNYERFHPNFDLTTNIAWMAGKHSSQVAIQFVKDFDPSTKKAITAEITYRELYEQASSAGGALSKHGVGPNDLVCIFLEKSLDLYVFIAAIAMIGAGYMCIDSRTPPERVASILQQGRCNLLIENPSGHRGHYYNSLVRTISTAELKSCEGHRGYSNAYMQDESSLAYAVFTSGTTGIPKGVLITRENLLSNIEALSKIYPYDKREDKLLQMCSPAFDVSVFEIFWTWHLGLTLCSATNDILFRDLEGFIDAMRVTHLSLTPSVAALVHPNNVPKVKMLVTAGEPMNSKVFEEWADRGLYQGYGPSETTNICNVKPDVSKSDWINNVGPPLSNTSIFVCPTLLDFEKDGLQLVPKGAVGEIWIGGDQVGRGYVDTTLTKQGFIDTEYGRLYRSGDVGRLLANDNLIILGRVDDQIKIRGQRVELSDISSALIRNSVVKDAATMVIDDENGNGTLVSFFSSPDSVQTSLEEHGKLWKDLESQLPSYMIPDMLLPVHEIPLTKQGKIDKQGLKMHYRAQSANKLSSFRRGDRKNEEELPLDEKGLGIAKALAKATGYVLNSIKANTSFFATGLDSISAVRFSRELKVMGFGQVDVSTIMQHSTINRLSVYLVQFEHTQNPSAYQIPPRPDIVESAWTHQIHTEYGRLGFEVEEILPCTSMQEIMLAQSQMNMSRAYQNQLEFEVRGSIDRLKAAWAEAVCRHRILRTGFVLTSSTDNLYAQVVVKNMTLPWQNDTKPVDSDLSIPPYSFHCSYTKDERKPVLTLAIHHALYDAEAMTLLLHDVEQIYRRERLRPPVSLDRYIDHMVHSDDKKNRDFWHNELSGLVPTSLVDTLRLALDAQTQTACSQASISLRIPVSLQSLRRSAQWYNTTLAVLVQAAWGRLLAFLFQSEDICFGNVFSGRNLPFDNIEKAVGPTFNTLPVRTRVMTRQTNKELVGLVQKSNFAILPHQPTSLRRISQPFSAKRKRLFDSLVLFQQEQPRLDGAIWKLEHDRGRMAFPVILEVVPDQDIDGIMAELHLDPDITMKSMAQGMLESFACLLEQIMGYPHGQTRNFDPIRHKLPLLGSGQAQVSSEASYSPEKPHFLQPSSDAAKMVHGVVTDLLRDDRSKVDEESTFFMLGFDSLSAVQIAARLRKLGFNITGADVLENPTIRQLAEFCNHSSAMKCHSPLSVDLLAFDYQHRHRVCKAAHIDAVTVESIRPCTATQSGILAQWINSEGRLYFNRVTLQLDKVVDLPMLRQAVAALTKRHEMLRTGFANLGNSKYAFAMITYHVDVYAVPWLDLQPDESDVRSKQSFERSHEPPWTIRLLEDANGVLLEIHMLHAIYDAQSLEILLKDMADLYLGKTLTPSRTINECLSSILSMESGDQDSARQFWTNQCKELQPSKFPNLNVYQGQTHRTSVRCRLIPMAQHEIETGCQRKGVTLQALCQVAWAQLLAMYTGASNVTFGVILSGRAFDRIMADTVFPSMNTVPCVMTVSDDLDGMLAANNLANVARWKYRFTPLSRIKRWVNVEEDLFDTVIVLQKYPSNESAHHLWTRREDDASAEYAISMEIVPNVEDKLELRLTFREQVMPPAQADILLRQFEEVFINIILTQGLSSDMNQDLLAVVPANDERIETDVLYLHQFVEDTTAKNPERTALEFASCITGPTFEMRSWTYKQLDAKGNKIAHFLIERGSVPGSLVAICFEKCPEAYFAILGVLKAGCAYVAIDPGAPEARKQFILKDAHCRILMTTRTQISSMEEMSDIIVVHVDDANTWDSQPEDKPALSRPLSAKDTCYCLYTSGTTGTPKGCLISHDSAVQAMMSFRRIFMGRWDEDSRWLQFASFHFDVSVLEQYWSWSVGICVTSAPRDLLFEDLPRAIAALKIDHLDLTPSLARFLKPEVVPRLCQGVFIVGGEQVRQEVLQMWGDVGCLYNFYGPSEVTIGCTVHKNVPKIAKPSNIGQQWDNVGSFVLEPHSQTPVLRGAIGELCLSGPLVAKGYLHRPELTKEKFVNLTKYDVRVYRTGDLVRLLHDESFDFVGRIDDQVKLRGQRLEISEINHIILGAGTEVTDAATIAAQHPKQSGEQLVTFFTGKNQTRPGPPRILFDPETQTLASSIRNHCNDHLPSYMVPTYILHMTSLPLSANNKADTKALKAQFERLSLSELQRSSRVEEHTDDQDSPLMKEVINVLALFLQIPLQDISSTSRLFELGIDSISAIGLSNSLRAAKIGNIDAATILKRPLVGDLVRALMASLSPDYDQRDRNAQSKLTRFEDKQRDLKFRIHESMKADCSNDGTLNAIRSCVAKLSGCELQDICADSNIFRLGLDSIDSIRLSTLLKSQGLFLQASVIMRSETLWQLSTLARTSANIIPDQKDESHHPGPTLQELEIPVNKTAVQQGMVADVIERVLPTTPMQEGLLANYDQYYNFGLLDLRPLTDLRRLQKAWSMAIERHPVLRTSFTEMYDPDYDAAFAQLVTAKGTLHWDEIEMEDIGQVVDLIAAKKASIAHSGLQYPPLSITIITMRTTAKRYQLLGMAHAIYDAWSLSLLHHDIACFYHGRAVIRPPYDKLLGRLLSENSEESTSFWKLALSSYIPRAFPSLGGCADRLRDVHLVTKSSSSKTNLIQSFCRTNQVSLQAFGLTCWTITLVRHSKRRDVCFGLVLSGRTMEDAHEIMFPTFNTVPFRITIGRDSTGSDLLQQIHEFSLEVSAHQELPLRKAKKLCGSSQDLFDTLFLLQKTPPDIATDLPNLYDQVELGSPTLEYPVNIEMQVSNDREIIWQAACKAALLNYEATYRLVNELDATAGTLLSKPEERINIDPFEEKHTSGNDHMLTNGTRASLTHDKGGYESEDREIECGIREVLALVARSKPEHILANTNYFTLGLDSMSAIKVASLLRKTKDISLPVSAILGAVTLENMVRVAKRLAVQDTSSDALFLKDKSARNLKPWDEKFQSFLESFGINSSSLESVDTATSGQIYMLERWKASSGRLFYNEFSWNCLGMSAEKLESAIEVLVSEIPLLRTTFVLYENKMFAIALRNEHQCRVAAIFETTRSERQLTLTLKIHHALYDAVSLPRMINRLAQMCEEVDKRQTPMSVDTNSFVAVTRDPERQEARQYFWRTYLSNVAKDAKTAVKQSRHQTNRIKAIHTTSRKDVALLTARARTAGVTLQSLLFAACANAYGTAIVCGEGQPEHDVVMGIYLANRGLDITGLEDSLFPTVNVVPLRVLIAEDLSLTDQARYVQEDLAVIQKADHCAVSLQEIWEWTNTKLDFVVNFVKIPETERRTPDLNQGIQLLPHTPKSDTPSYEDRRSWPSPFSSGEPAVTPEWCLPTIDVEAKVDDDGGLAIGIFAPENLINQSQARQLLDLIQDSLIDTSNCSSHGP